LLIASLLGKRDYGLNQYIANADIVDRELSIGFHCTAALAEKMERR
jgi:hypothetical protein